MKQIDKDRAVLKRLVESYGKQDVLKFVRHLNESVNYQYTVVADTNSEFLYEFGNYASNEDLMDNVQNIAKEIENEYAPGKIKVTLDSNDAWIEDGYVDVYHYTITIKFNNDLTQEEADNILYDLVLPGASILCSYDEDLCVRNRNGEQITLRDIEYYANGGPNTNNEEDVFEETGPTYSGDYIALAKLAGIRR